MTQRTAVYRAWSRSGELFYIGISNDCDLRYRQHARAESWWCGEVARCTGEWFPSRDAAEAAEVLAIKAEGPKYNVRHNGATCPLPARQGQQASAR